MGQLYSLKYDKEKLNQYRASKKFKRGVVKPMPLTANTTGLSAGEIKVNINNSGGSDESGKDPERARSSSVVSNKDRGAYLGYAYSEENYASSALAHAVRRSTKKLIAEGKV